MADLCVARASGIEGFERYVVIKHLRPEQSSDEAFVQMFVTEARLAGALHHANIVQVHDIGQEKGRHFFAMEYVHGEDLRRLLSKLCERHEHPPLEHIVTIGMAVAAALHHAHEQKGNDRKPLNIVHRDVTPANIIVGYDGNVKVVDFGIAKAAMRTSDTGVGMLKGKVPYMAPEQCTGKPIDRRSDIFSLGIVLYELATVRRLFKGGNEFFTMTAVVQGDIPKPSLHRKDLPAELEAIILKALSRKPQDRYQTADELRIALDKFADKANLRTSVSGLADYMKKLFGTRPEPGMAEEPLPPLDDKGSVDFDKTDVGLAAVPEETLQNNAMPKSVGSAQGSLIEQARLTAIKEPTPKPPKLASVVKPPVTPVRGVPAGARPRVEEVKTQPGGTHAPPPPPLDAPMASDTIREPIVDEAIHRAETKPGAITSENDSVAIGAIGEARAATDIDEKTDVGTPPPPPSDRVSSVIVAAADRESTEIVRPLAVVVGDDTTIMKPKFLDKRWLFAGGIAVAALSVAIIIMVTGRKVDEVETPPPENPNEAGKIDLSQTPPPSPDTDPVASTGTTAYRPLSDDPKTDDTKTDDTKPADTKTDDTAIDVTATDDTATDDTTDDTATDDTATDDTTDDVATTDSTPDVAKPDTTAAAVKKVAAKTPTKRTTRRTTRRVKKTTKTAKTTKTTKTSTPPTWDPDALFLNKKK